MKRLVTGLFSVLLLIAVFFLFPKASMATSPVDISKRLESDVSKVNEMTGFSAKTDTNVAEMIVKYTSFDSYFKESITFYTNASPQIAINYKPICDEAAVADTTLSKNLEQLNKALNSKDESLYNAGIDGLNSGIDALNRTIDDYNKIAKGNDMGPIYIVLAVVFGLLSLIMLAKTRVKVIGPATAAKKKVMQLLFKNSLVPAGGAIVTAVWYYMTPPGSTYFIFWGPVLVGAFYFISACSTYLKTSRKVLNAAVKEEKQAAKDSLPNIGNQGVTD